MTASLVLVTSSAFVLQAEWLVFFLSFAPLIGIHGNMIGRIKRTEKVADGVIEIPLTLLLTLSGDTMNQILLSHTKQRFLAITLNSQEFTTVSNSFTLPSELSFRLCSKMWCNIMSPSMKTHPNALTVSFTCCPKTKDPYGLLVVHDTSCHL